MLDIPFIRDRQRARAVHDRDIVPFYEVFIDTLLDVCECRDNEGLYKRARAGEIKSFTGIDQPYEAPTEPDLVIKAGENDVNECIKIVVEFLTDKGIISADVISEDLPKELFVEAKEISFRKRDASKLPKLDVSKIDVQWIQVLSEGWATPLDGFMDEDQYLQCLHFSQLLGGKNHSMSIPIVLPITAEDKERLYNVASIALNYNGKDMAILKNSGIFDHRKEERCGRVFGTTNRGHPVIDMIMNSGDYLIGGQIEVLERIKWNDGLDHLRLTPKEIRKKFTDMKADAVFAFQLRNPIHNGHALLMQDTRRQLLSSEYNFKNPVLLLHPLGGWTKDDDVPLDVRIKQHEAVLSDPDSLLDAENTLLAIFPSPMSYAGPREVQWHAKARIVTGATFYIVGRDPAGIPHPDDPQSDLYQPTHGRRVLQMAPGLTALNIIPFRVAAYNKVLQRMDFYQSDKKDDYQFISGTIMRTLARDGKEPPAGFMSKSAWKVLEDYYQSINNSGVGDL